MEVLLTSVQSFDAPFDENEVDFLGNYEDYERAAAVPVLNNAQLEANYPKLTLTLVNPVDITQTFAFVYIDTPNILKHPWFNWRLQTLIYAFGFTEDMASNTTQLILEAYIKRGGHNLLVIDWSAYNGKVPNDYQLAVGNMKAVGGLIGSRLSSVFTRIMIRRMHLVGFSLGAHLCAYVNRALPDNLFSDKIHKIIGLDPAGPLMYDLALDNKPLSGSDADVVQVIHTDMQEAGAPVKSGTIDFYPNGGGINGIQPGCPIFDNDNRFIPGNFCSHKRAVQFYAESVTNKENVFAATRCGNYSDFLFARCEKHDQQMGFNAKDYEFVDFYLQTNSFAPFDRGLAGATYVFTAP
ncbi:phospholipase A1 VesT1.02-like [Chironomus tepperi]|uniref:phospholipase A1 VesT1.02-like n=1 Tax=Chironomus tepperi TaxID=113505 RepID=UPI00391F3658